jgi:HSP20 family protein
MARHEMQPYEGEEHPFWSLTDWPSMRSFMPAFRGFFPSSDLSVWEEKDHVFVEAPLPGITASDVELTYERGVLTIRGQKKEEKEDKERKYFNKSNTSFLYRLTIPGDVDEGEEPEAKLENGILRISFKKHKKEAPRRINVKTS